MHILLRTASIDAGEGAGGAKLPARSPRRLICLRLAACGVR